MEVGEKQRGHGAPKVSDPHEFFKGGGHGHYHIALYTNIFSLGDSYLQKADGQNNIS